MHRCMKISYARKWTHSLSLSFSIHHKMQSMCVSLLFSINLNELNAIIKFQINSFLCCLVFFYCCCCCCLLLLQMDSLASKKKWNFKLQTAFHCQIGYCWLYVPIDKVNKWWRFPRRWSWDWISKIVWVRARAEAFKSGGVSCHLSIYWKMYAFAKSMHRLHFVGSLKC